MIDLHCHFLPGIDDGPATLAQGLALARHAQRAGIRISVVTPHVHAARYANTAASIRAAAQDFAAELERHGIALGLGFAAEVRIGIEVLEMAERGDLPFLGELGGMRLFLLELPHSHIPVGSDKLVARLLRDGIRPVIAHPERNKAVLRDLERIRPFVAAGCALQVTAGAVCGDFGAGPQQRARELLALGWVTLLASDAHNLEDRPPELERGRAAAAGIVGEEAAWALVRGTPERILGASALLRPAAAPA